MLDWTQYVRQNLRVSGLQVEREAEVVEDLAEQLEDAYADGLQRGLSPSQAEAATKNHIVDWRALANEVERSRVGRETSMTALQNRAEDRSIATHGEFSLCSGVMRDARYAFRMLAKSPGFAAVAILTLALGIGANTAVFSVFNGMLWRPLPAKDPGQLVVLTAKTSGDAFDRSLSYPDLLDYRELKQVFADVTAVTPRPVNLGADGRAERAWTEFVMGNYFSLLGVQMVRGRAFGPEEGLIEGKDPLMILGYKFWQHRFGGDAGVIGHTVEVNQHAFTIIGVAPADFHGTYFFIEPDFYLPVTMLSELEPSDLKGLLKDRNASLFVAMGRLRPGITWQKAKAATGPVNQRLQKLYPDTHASYSLQVYPELKARPQPGAVAEFMPEIVAAFMSLVGLVLIIACANVANLMIAHANGRRKEIATRLALGAKPWHAVRQLLTESVLLSVAGGIAGLALSHWAGLALMSVHIPTDIPLRLFDLRMDYRIFGFAFLIALFTGALAGIFPALRISRTDIVETLNESGRSGGMSARQNRLRSALVIAQVAVSVLLLASAGFFVRSFQKAARTDMGFRVDHLLKLSVDLGLQGYTADRGQQFYEQVQQRVRTLPGVRDATVSAVVPMGYVADETSIFPEGEVSSAKSQAESVLSDSVQPGYFHTLGVQLIEGREFATTDTARSPKVAIVNEAFAQRFWPQQDPLGKTFQTDRKGPAVQIVGLTRTGKYNFLYEPPFPYVYFPLEQRYSASATLFVYTEGDPLQIAGPVQEVVHQFDAALPLYDVMSMKAHVQNGKPLLFPRLAAVLVGVFGLLGLVLACVGVYSVVAYSVSQRTREIGIRTALGAQRSNVLKLVLKQGMIPALIGASIGVMLAFLLFHGLHSVLYGVHTTDLFTLAIVSALMLAVALVASCIPALRAIRVDPMLALRHE